MPKKPTETPLAETSVVPAEPPARLSAVEELEELLAKKPGLARGRGPDAPWRQIYFKALECCAIRSVAARVAGVTPQALSWARLHDPTFALAESEAMEAGIDLVEASAFRSAVYGELQPIYHQGELCGHTVKLSDAMRTLILRGRRRDIYGLKPEPKARPKRPHLTLDELERRLKDAGFETTNPGPGIQHPKLTGHETPSPEPETQNSKLNSPESA